MKPVLEFFLVRDCALRPADGHLMSRTLLRLLSEDAWRQTTGVPGCVKGKMGAWRVLYNCPNGLAICGSRNELIPLGYGRRFL
jgi:hypothetical protein